MYKIKAESTKNKELSLGATDKRKKRGRQSAKHKTNKHKKHKSHTENKKIK